MEPGIAVYSGLKMVQLVDLDTDEVLVEAEGKTLEEALSNLLGAWPNGIDW